MTQVVLSSKLMPQAIDGLKFVKLVRVNSLSYSGLMVAVLIHKLLTLMMGSVAHMNFDCWG